MKLMALLLFALCTVPLAAAQPMPPQPLPAAPVLPGALTVTGSGTVYGQPDQALIEVGVNISGEDLTAALAEANAVIADVIEAIRGEGVARDDIRTTYFNIWREEPYRPDGMPGTPVYRVNNILSVTIRDTDEVGDVLDAAVGAGANAVNTVQYTLSNPDDLARQARELAFANASAKAEQLAGLAGLSLGPVVSLSDGSSFGDGPGIPEPMRMMMDAGAGIPVMGGQLAVSASVRVSFALQQRE